MDDIETVFLCERCQTAESVAKRLAQFIGQATETLDLAIYSFNLCDEARDTVIAALRDRQKAGVAVRVAYDAGAQQDQAAEPDDDKCDKTTPEFVSSLSLQSKPIESYHALMHHKYVVVDAGKPTAQVWTGSANFTDDSWTLQESNIIILHSQELAGFYTYDFNELWVDGSLESPKQTDHGETTVSYKGKQVPVAVYFSPIEGEWIDERIAQLIDQTRERLTLACVVLTSGKIINAILNLMKRGVALEGIYDRTQMEGVKYQWQMVPDNHWKIGAFEEIVRYGKLAGKNSTPYTPQSKHDFMHNKVMVLDDQVLTGSYNFSRHAQQNAENVLLIDSPELAQTYREYIHGIMEKYKASGAAASSGAAGRPAKTAPPAPST